ncbi:MAG: hypothetical protein ACK559_09210, partial [bacterium]
FEPDFSQYPYSTADSNFINFLKECLLNERNNIFDLYWQEGFLGKNLLYLIDKMIVACFTTFELITSS